ncbi:MAG: efflux RND transporter periplasmic adaptor subunit, partial [Lewinella sp.]|nr:efflux RND transporter periplasmic adaptor subunit [Lewinella sp.]
SQASIYAPVAGFVQHLPHHLPGDFVRQGTELIRLTHPDFARRQRELLESNSRLRFLELDLQRKQELAEGDATSQRSLQQAEADFNLEKARFDGIRAELKMMGFAVDNIIASGEIQSSLAIYAPVSGYLTHVSVNQGMLVSPTDELMMLIDNGHLHLELDVFAKDLPKVAEAQAITCWLPGTDATFPAAVHQIGRVIDPETRTARIHGHFASEPVPLTAGTYMQARIETAPDSVLTVPYTAIAREGEQAFIFVKEGEGYRRQPVQLGREKGDLIELIDYQERHPIAVNGAYYLNGSMGEE